MKTRTMQPGDKGAGRRKFTSESELAESTICPLFLDGTHPALTVAPGFIPKATRDSSVCYGPDCPKWFANITRDAQGVPIRAEVGCLAGKRTNAMGIIERDPPVTGAEGQGIKFQLANRKGGRP